MIVDGHVITWRKRKMKENEREPEPELEQDIARAVP
jgi:hypothetical protein